MQKAYSNPIALIVGVPVLFIAVVAVISFLTTSMVQPQHRFVYVIGGASGWYSATNAFAVSDGRLVALVEPGSARPHAEDELRRWEAAQKAQLYVFDPETWSSRPITYEEARELRLDPQRMAPDGYEVTNSRSSGGIFPFFGTEDDRAIVISKGALSRKLPISADYYRADVFIGWVLE